jgi:hypothetical protein
LVKTVALDERAVAAIELSSLPVLPSGGEMRARPYRSLSAVLQPELPQNRTFAVDP